MRNLAEKNGERKIVFLTQTYLEILIYTCNDVWITPEVKKFKRKLLERTGKKC